jgi:metallo-beta-lactamase family protein
LAVKAKTKNQSKKLMKEIKLTFCGGVGEVTGANFLLQVGEHKLLIDCGMVQGGEAAHASNYKPFPYNPTEINALIITHAHIDHIGRVPKLVKEGFAGPIYSTDYTKELAPIMLSDSARLIAQDAQHRNIEPLYVMPDVERALSQWQGGQYHKSFTILPGIEINYRNAGHILGSAMVEMTIGEGNDKRKIVFTGDLGNTPSPLLPDTEVITDADYMVMESVYGDRNHPPAAERSQKLKEELKKGIERGGTVLIPMFSLEKTQELLHELNHLFNSGELKSVPVFLDSPMAQKVTEVYKHAGKEFNPAAQKEMKGDDIFDFPGLINVQGREESETILASANPKIVIAGSGMSSGGRVVRHEQTVLPDEKNTVLFLGYQSVGTLGRQLVDGVKKVNAMGMWVKVRAHVTVVGGYSSHKDSDHLQEFVSHSAQTLKKVFVVMGETKTALFLAQRLRDFVNVKAFHPQENETVILD